MNLALEYATLTVKNADGERFPIWVTNGPVTVELDLWSPVGGSDGDGRALCEVLLRHTSRLLTLPDPPVSFVPTVEEACPAWQVGLRMGRIAQVEAHEPKARKRDGLGEAVIVGDPAFRIVLIAYGDSATLRTDRVGIETLAKACHKASRLLRQQAKH